MQEDTAKQIMSAFFRTKGTRAVPSRGAGPDFIVEGKAVEVKGTKFDLKKALKQCWDYAQRYSEVTIALPVDSFNLDRLWAFRNLSNYIKKVREFPLKFYLIVKSGKEKDCYYVREYKELDSSHPTTMGAYDGFVEREPESTIDKAIQNMLSPKHLLIKDMADECMKEQFRTVTKICL